MKILRVALTDSTNSDLARRADTLEAPALLIAGAQSAGRGQRGNSWEAEPGMNITMSLLLRPVHVAPANQFALSRAVSLAIVETLDPLLEGTPHRAMIKWPNDIYVGDRKIAGILIENTISSTVLVQSIIGLGLNVNQTRFVSDAPNPVSLKQLTGRDLDVNALAERLAEAIAGRVGAITGSAHQSEAYMSRLWRRHGLWRYRDTATGRLFRASIVNIDPDGRLHLQPEGEPSPRAYYFKEVEAIL